MRITKKQYQQLLHSKKADIFIGVVPSGEKPDVNKNGTFKRGNVGLCIAASQTDILFFDSVNLFEFQRVTSEYIKGIYPGKVFVAVVEQPDGQAAYQRANINNWKKFGKQNRDLGKNQLASNIIVAWLRHLGVEVIEVTPKQKGRKWLDVTFLHKSKYKGKLLKCHSHAIDGYQLIYPY